MIMAMKWMMRMMICDADDFNNNDFDYHDCNDDDDCNNNNY